MICKMVHVHNNAKVGLSHTYVKTPKKYTSRGNQKNPQL